MGDKWGDYEETAGPQVELDMRTHDVAQFLKKNGPAQWDRLAQAIPEDLLKTFGDNRASTRVPVTDREKFTTYLLADIYKQPGQELSLRDSHELQSIAMQLFMSLQPGKSEVPPDIAHQRNAIELIHARKGDTFKMLEHVAPVEAALKASVPAPAR